MQSELSSCTNAKLLIIKFLWSPLSRYLIIYHHTKPDQQADLFVIAILRIHTRCSIVDFVLDITGYDIYQFFAGDPDSRTVEIQTFEHETPDT